MLVYNSQSTYLDVDFVPRNGRQYFVFGTFDVQTEIVNSSSAHSD